MSMTRAVISGDEGAVEKLILAYQDNHKDLAKAKNCDDQEEILFCEGYERAMEYVMWVLGIGCEAL
nr:hypothetical protein [Eubacterium sp.]